MVLNIWVCVYACGYHIYSSLRKEQHKGRIYYCWNVISQFLYIICTVSDFGIKFRNDLIKTKICIWHDEYQWAQSQLTWTCL